MIDIKKAKVRLLSLAFRGALIDYSKKEKQNDALDVLHKTAKNYSPVSEDEYLIDSPPFWNWSRLAYVTNNHGQTVPDKDFCYIDVGTLDNVHQRLAAEENLVAAKDAPSRARKVVQIGDVLYSTVRPYLHNICIVDRAFSRTPIASTAFCVMQPNERVLLNKFLFYWLLTPEFDKYSNGDPSKGALYPAIGEKDLLRGTIPIPSIEEQSLIVDKIDAAFSALDTIDSLQKQYADNLTVLKAKLIDAAIQGKLTEQLQEDGTAEELYQQVQAERKRQENVGTVKAVELASDIDESDQPFNVPQNWKWTHLGNVSYIVRGGSPRPIKQYITTRDDGINWIKIGDVEKGGKYIYSTHEKIIPEGESKSRRVYPGDFLLTNSMSFGRPYISKIEGCIHDGWLLIHSLDGFNPDYLYYLLSSTYLYGQFTAKASGSTVDNLNIDKVKNAIIPLPPLAEQKRIAQKIDELMPLFEK